MLLLLGVDASSDFYVLGYQVLVRLSGKGGRGYLLHASLLEFLYYSAFLIHDHFFNQFSKRARQSPI